MFYLEYKKHPEIRKDVEPLFVSAFPSNERPDPKHYFLSFEKPINQLFAFYDDDFVGFASTVHYKDICYIFFLAVSEKKRNQGYGSKILNEMKNLFKDDVILLCYEEVDDKYPDNDMRKRRAEFYHRNGFTINPLKTNEFGVIFQTAYFGKHKVSFEDYQEIFKIGFGAWTVDYLKEVKN